jgi:plasmid stabilization system protein ParE
MASKPLEFHREAEEEYLSALAWYQERSPTAAINFESAFDRAIKTISEAPHRWPVYLAGCRRYALHQFPFIIVYSTLGSHTVVLAVAHGHRRPGYWMNRI